jgi:hypothetical protein
MQSTFSHGLQVNLSGLFAFDVSLILGKARFANCKRSHVESKSK